MGSCLQRRKAAGGALTRRAALRRRYLYHQKEMLEDQVRMQAYYDSVFSNKACFEGKARRSPPGRRIPPRLLTLVPRAGCAGRGHRQRHLVHLGGAGGRAQGVRRRGAAALPRPRVSCAGRTPCAARRRAICGVPHAARACSHACSLHPASRAASAALRRRAAAAAAAAAACAACAAAAPSTRPAHCVCARDALRCAAG